MSGIKSILTLIQGAFNTPQAPLSSLPPPLLSVGANMRTGLSAEAISARVISRFEEIGVSAGPNSDGSDNIMSKLVVVMVEEIINSLLTESKVEISINPGIPVSSMGANIAGPVASTGISTSFASGAGVIR